MNDATHLLTKPYRLLLGFQAMMIADDSVQAIQPRAPELFAQFENLVEDTLRYAGDLAADAERCEHLPDELPRLRLKLALVDARLPALHAALDELRRVALAP